MFNLSVENHKGELLELTNNSDYTITKITGLNPPTANINTSTNANFDGSTFKSSRLNERNVVIELIIEGDIESNRIKLYKFFKTRFNCRLHYSNNTRDVFIDGCVESFEVDLFEQRQKAQISILCPKSHLINETESVIDFVSINDLFVFPFNIAEEGIPFSELKLNEVKTVINAGEIPTGIVIDFKALGTVINPKLYNTETGEHLFLNIEMNEGDIIRVNTNKGEKSIIMTIDGVESNIINSLDYGSTWLQLESGDNLFLYTADELPENLQCTFTYYDKFEGV